MVMTPPSVPRDAFLPPIAHILNRPPLHGKVSRVTLLCPRSNRAVYSLTHPPPYSKPSRSTNYFPKGVEESSYPAHIPHSAQHPGAWVKRDAWCIDECNQQRKRNKGWEYRARILFRLLTSRTSPTCTTPRPNIWDTRWYLRPKNIRQRRRV